MTTDYWEDQRLGQHILQTNIDLYRKLRNTMRWMLGTLAHYRGEQVALDDMPELERLMLHRLVELDDVVRKGYDAFDFKRISRAVGDFMVVELSAFYFDIRKDALYCDPISSTRRKAALQVVAALFDHVSLWLAPMLPFTMEEAWLTRHPSDTGSVHLQQFPPVDAAWRNDALAAKWRKVRAVRRAVTGALEVERREKRIGSSLEAAPKVFIADQALAQAVAGVDMAEICITSAIDIQAGDGPAGAFRLEDLATVAVVPTRAEGTKCARSWKISTEIGSDPDYPDITPRDAEAMREWEAAARMSGS